VIDLKALILGPPAALVEDPAAIARRELEVLRAERARRAAAAEPPRPAPVQVGPLEPDRAAVIARVEAEYVRREDREELMGDPDDRLAEQCRRKLSRFAQEAWKVLHPNVRLEWSHHHDALCDHLQWLLEGWIRKQMDPSYQQAAKQMAVNLPPISLKTELMMEFAPAWMWVRWPAWRVLALSCNPRVALQSSVNSRRVIESPWYQRVFKPDWKLLDDQNAKSNFGNTAGGQRQSHGWSATIVGEHADAILVDDPTDPKQVTRAALEAVNADWPSIRNRVNDERSAIRVGIQQRLDVDDWTGNVTSGKSGASWVSVVFPLEFEAARRCRTAMPVDANNRLCLDPAKVVGTWQDPRQVEGELLQPSRYPPDVLEELRLTAGPYGWSSQYQQNPVPREGGRVKRAWLKFCRLAGHDAGTRPRPDGCVTLESPDGATHTIARKPTPNNPNAWDLDWIYLTIDPASKKTERGSLYGMLAIGAKGARRFVLDDRSKRGEIDEILEIIRDLVRTWRPSRLLIEDTAAGPTIIRTLKEELGAGKITADGKNIICIVQGLSPAEVGGDKEARLDGVINQIAAGLLYVLEGAPWVAEFIDELTLFPNGPTKDRVDALTQLLAIARSSASSAWLELFKGPK
jgi:predicted phage terminase large subunit-like protein